MGVGTSILVAFLVYLLAAIVSFGIAGLVIVLYRFLDRFETPKAIEEAVVPQSVGVSPVLEMDPGVIAAISGALTALYGTKIRVKKIKYRPADSDTSWSKHGRTTVMTSHNLNRK